MTHSVRKISVVELMDQLMPGADKDLVKPLHKRIEKRYEAIYLKTKVTKIEAQKTGLKVTFEGEQAPEPQLYDRVLMAVGRRPNGREIDAEAAGLIVNERGFIPVDKQMRTNVPHIFAIGDIVGDPMLAHKAVHEGKVAAENHRRTQGLLRTADHSFRRLHRSRDRLDGPDRNASQGTRHRIRESHRSRGPLPVARCPSRAKKVRPKCCSIRTSRRILGAGIVGVNAGELIAEAVLALEMGADMEDIGLTIHPHPTLSETLCFAAEMAEGTITDLLAPKKKH